MLVVQRAAADQEVTSQPATQIIDNTDAYGVSHFFDRISPAIFLFRWFGSYKLLYQVEYFLW